MSCERLAVVSGTGGPIDGAISTSLLELGFSVEWVGQRGDSWPPPSNRLTTTTVDFTHEDEIRGAVQSIVERREKIDVLITCPDRCHCLSLSELTDEDWEESMAINLTSVFLVCKHVVPVMMKQRTGKIVNVISDAARIGAYHRIAYASAKGAVIGLSKSLAREVAAHGITVNLISVGLIGEGAMPFRQDPEGSAIPMGRAGTWEEVATVCVCLLEQKMSYMTGQTIHVNGGLLMP